MATAVAGCSFAHVVYLREHGGQRGDAQAKGGAHTGGRTRHGRWRADVLGRRRGGRRRRDGGSGGRCACRRRGGGHCGSGRRRRRGVGARRVADRGCVTTYTPHTRAIPSVNAGNDVCRVRGVVFVPQLCVMPSVPPARDAGHSPWRESTGLAGVSTRPAGMPDP